MITSEVDNLFEELKEQIAINNINTIFTQKVVINSDHVIVQDIGGVDKYISIIDFIQVLNLLVGKGIDLSIKSLPFNCFTFGSSISEIELGCYYPERIVEIKFDSSGVISLYKIPLPNIIISTKLVKDSTNWRVTRVNYFTTNKRVTQLPENKMIWGIDFANGIYGVPFPNFYVDGQMCYGKNNMPNIFTDNLRGLDYYYQVIINTPFNADLGVKGVAWTKGARSWFEYLSTLDSFPYQLFTK